MRLISSLLIMMFIASFSTAQVIDELRVDEFTKDTIKTTSWELFYQDFTNTNHFRLKKVNGKKALEIKLMLGNSIFYISKHDSLFLKTDNGELLKFFSIQSAVTERGAGAIGLNGSGTFGIDIFYYPTDTLYFNILKQKNIVKIRIYTSNGFVDMDIKKKNSKKINKAFSIIDTNYKPKRVGYGQF